MRCRRVQKHLVAYAEAELGERERLLVEEHLSACDTCRSALVLLEQTRPGPPTPPSPPPEFWAPMHEAILRELESTPVSSAQPSRRPWAVAYATLMAATVLWTLFSFGSSASDATPLSPSSSTSAVLIP